MFSNVFLDVHISDIALLYPRCSIPSFIYSFSNYLLNALYEQELVIGAKDIAVDRVDQTCPHGVHIVKQGGIQ